MVDSLSPLPPGDYRFRYIADGYWFTDFASHGIEACENGWNSVVLVPEKKVVMTIANNNETSARSVA